MDLINYEGCDGTGGCEQCKDEASAPPFTGMGGGPNSPPSKPDPKNPFNLSAEQRRTLKKNKKEAKKFKKNYDLRYRISFGIVIAAGIMASVGAEIAYTGCGVLLFGLLVLFGARIYMTGSEQVRNLISQYIVKMEMTLGGTEVLNPQDMIQVNNPGAKPGPPNLSGGGTGQYI